MCGWWQCYHTQWWNPQKKYMFVCLYQFQDLFEFMRIYDGGINILGWSSRGSHNSITADNAVSLQKQHTRDNHIVANDRSRVHIFIIIVVINLHISSARSSCSHPDHRPPTIGLTQLCQGNFRALKHSMRAGVSQQGWIYWSSLIPDPPHQKISLITHIAPKI